MSFPRDLETPFFQALIEQAKPVSVPIQNLELIFNAVAKYINSPAGWVLAKLSIYKKAEPVDGFPHIRWGRA